MIERLVVGTPPAKNQERAAELLKALQKNIACKHIKAITLVIEENGLDDAMLEAVESSQNKVETHTIARRMTWAGAVDVACAGTSPGGIAAVANADVWFDHTAQLFDNWTRWSDVLFAVYRNAEPNVQRADAWLFKPPFQLEGTDIPLGLERGDQRICAMAQNAGFLVLNPAVDIMLHHEHANHPGYDGSKRADPPWGFSTLMSFNAEDPE